MDKNVKRINWYTRKIAQLGSVHPTKRSDKWYRRAERLLVYKDAMHEAF